jgi:Tol biopolymer transport system component
MSGDGRTVAYDSWCYLCTGSLTVRDLDSGLYEWNPSGDYGGPSLSADGNYLAYDYSTSGGIDANAYWRRLSPAWTVLAGSGNRNQGQSAISGDGQTIVYTTHSTDLVPNDTNARGDVILYRKSDGSKTRISVSSDGVQGNGDSYQADLSADGRLIVFTSDASNLVPGDTNGVSDIFVHDTVNGSTERVSVATDGLQANGYSLGSSISDDGRFIVFRSYASNLVAGDSNETADLFLHDRMLGTTERVSVGWDGGQSNGASGLYSQQRAIFLRRRRARSG